MEVQKFEKLVDAGKCVERMQGWENIHIERMYDEDGGYWFITCQRPEATGDRLILRADGYVR